MTSLIAVVAFVGYGLFVRAARPDDSARRRAVAEANTTSCDKDDTAYLEEKLLVISRDLDALDARVRDAVGAVAKAPNETARVSAIAMLTALEMERKLMNAHAVAARAALERSERHNCVKISKECMDNPLATGCS